MRKRFDYHSGTWHSSKSREVFDQEGLWIIRYCVLSAKHEDATNPYILIVCNGIGSPMESRMINIEPLHLAMTAQQVCCSFWVGCF